MIFLNGLPIAVIELKSSTDENATITNAFNQLQTYKDQIPSLFVFNEFLLVISDGLEARVGRFLLTVNGSCRGEPSRGRNWRQLPRHSCRS